MSIFKDHFPRMGASGAQSTGYEIDQSIRFNDDDTAYMSRTPGSAGDRRTWTWSGWVKRGDLSTYSAGRVLLHHGDSGSGLQEVIRIDSAATNQYLMYYSDPDSGYVRTNATVNDPAAWYHFIFVKDTTQAISNERFLIYINGVRQTSLQNSIYPSQNSQGYINNTVLHRIGADQNGSSSNYDGYLAEVHFLDGYAYGPEYFGEFNSSGIWIPKEYEGSYGTNGFYMKGEDSSNLGNDSSGNGNDFTTSGLAAHDQVLDTPTNNFNTLNPLYATTAVVLSEGNLEGIGSNASYRRIVGTQAVSSGKWYYEGYIIKTTVNNPTFGWVLTTPEDASNYAQPGTGAHEAAVMAAATGQTHVGKAYVNNTLSSSYTSTTAAGDIFGIAIDFDNLGFYIHKNGTYYNSGDPTSGSSKTGSLDASGLEANEYTPALGCQDSNSSAYLNFGQDGTFGGLTSAGGNSDSNGIGNFKYSVPSGYLALCTKNLGAI